MDSVTNAMNIYGSWEVERESTTSMARLCVIKIDKLKILKSIENCENMDYVVSIHLDSSRRTLRSNPVNITFVEDHVVEINLNFSFKYTHYLKRWENLVLISIQNRKKFKTAAFLGYKTICSGVFNLNMLLQSPVKQSTLNLFCKNEKKPLVEMSIVSFTSNPFEPDSPIPNRINRVKGSNQEDDFVSDSSVDDLDYTINKLQSESMHGEINRFATGNKTNNVKLKDKIISFLNRMKISDEDLGRVGTEILGIPIKSTHNSESQTDEDSPTATFKKSSSHTSTIGPKFKPFFDKSLQTFEDSNLVSDQMNSESYNKFNYDGPSDESLSDVENLTKTNLPTNFSRNNSSSITEKWFEPNIAFTNKKDLMVENDSVISDKVMEVKSFDLNEMGGSSLTSLHTANINDVKEQIDNLNKQISSFILINKDSIINNYTDSFKLPTNFVVIIIQSITDASYFLNFVFNRIKSFLKKNDSSVGVNTIRIVLFGNETLSSLIIQSMVELVSSFSLEIMGYLVFQMIPLGKHRLCEHIALIDEKYNSLFNDNFWNNLFGSQVVQYIKKSDVTEIFNRIYTFLMLHFNIHQYPIAEAMLSIMVQSSISNSYESKQVFLPVIMGLDIVTDDLIGRFSINNMNPSHTNHPLNRERPISFNLDLLSVKNSRNLDTGSDSPVNLPHFTNSLDLQIEYWLNDHQTSSNKKDESKRDNKVSVKANFIMASVYRSQPFGSSSTNQKKPPLWLSYIIRPKNPKLQNMVSKKKSIAQSFNSSASRVICSSRHQGQTFTVKIDGIPYENVKFFSVSCSWSTTIHDFPIGITFV